MSGAGRAGEKVGIVLGWAVGKTIRYFRDRAAYRREAAAIVKPYLTEREQEMKWEQNLHRQEIEKRSRRPTTNTLYGGEAPSEKSHK